MRNILAADIGGTNSRFAHFQVDGKKDLFLKGSKWLLTKESLSFEHLLAKLRESDFGLQPEQADIAVFAVAGPVEDGVRSRPPLIAWNIDLAGAGIAFGQGKFLLINDFVAQAYACRSPIMRMARQIMPAIVNPLAPLVVIGAGTGLGQGILIPLAGGGYKAIASEGGNTSFPFELAEEAAYMQFLLDQTGQAYIDGNVVLSGRGLSLLHQFLTGAREEPEQIAAVLGEDSPTLRWMARFYGRVCRNLALQVVAFGGVYVSGGLAAKIPALVSHPEFATTFHSSPTMPHILEKIPVFLNVNEESGLWGAAVFGMHVLEEEQ